MRGELIEVLMGEDWLIDGRRCWLTVKWDMEGEHVD